MKSPTEVVYEMFKSPFVLLKHIGVFIFKGRVLNSKEGASLSKPKDYKHYLTPYNQGVMLNGHRLKLSPKHSFQHTVVIGRPGAHKTTGYVIPNILEKAKQKASLVINDPKGEIHHLTSHYLQKNGYNVILIDPQNSAQSSRFNPLLEVNDEMELEQLAEVLVKAKNGSQGDPFWEGSAIRYVSLFLKVLKNIETKDPSLNTLHNLLYLFQNFGEDGKPLTEFMVHSSLIHDNPTDSRLWNEWMGLITGNSDGIRSSILTALEALRWLTNQNIVRITASSSFSLKDIRKRKTAIFFVTPPQHASYYAAFTSIFFKCVYNVCMSEMPKRSDLPVYVFHDEFATSYIPDFVSIANTIRGYNVSLSIILQSVKQLYARYGKDYAESILGGFSSYLTYAGGDLETTNFMQNMAGTVRERQKKHILSTTDSYREYKLLNTDEVRRMHEFQALFLTKNQNPILLDFKPYYQISKYKLATKPPFKALSNKNNPPDDIRYIEL